MSDRLHIGPTAARRCNATDDPVYDLVLTREQGALPWILHWLSGGPWKITIADIWLWQRLEPLIASVMTGCGHLFPDDISSIYCDGECFGGQTRGELLDWIAERQAEV